MGQEDRKKNSVDRINQAHNAYQNARLLNRLSKGRLGKGALSAARSALSAARGIGGLFATSEVWLPALVIGLVAVVVVTTFIVLGGQAQTAETSTPPSTEQTQTTTPGQSNNIYSWQSQITDAIQPFGERCQGDSSYVNNVMLKTITNGSYTATVRPGSACGFDYANTYWCTLLVIDSYNLAGVKNSFTSKALAVRFMIPEWETIPGGSVRKNSDVRGIIPGDAVFWLRQNDAGTADHVSLVSQVDVDPKTGNGYVVTNDANTNKKSNTFYVRDFLLKSGWLGGLNIPWFGLAPR